MLQCGRGAMPEIGEDPLDNRLARAAPRGPRAFRSRDNIATQKLLCRYPPALPTSSVGAFGFSDTTATRSECPMVNAATTRSSTDKLLKRARSRSRERAAHALRRDEDAWPNSML